MDTLVSSAKKTWPPLYNRNRPWHFIIQVHVFLFSIMLRVYSRNSDFMPIVLQERHKEDRWCLYGLPWRHLCCYYTTCMSGEKMWWSSYSSDRKRGQCLENDFIMIICIWNFKNSKKRRWQRLSCDRYKMINGFPITPSWYLDFNRPSKYVHISQARQYEMKKSTLCSCSFTVKTWCCNGWHVYLDTVDCGSVKSKTIKLVFSTSPIGMHL